MTNHSPSSTRLAQDLRDAPKIIAKGFCMGTADIIPGVSGGTMAFVLGIYERLLEAIKSFDKAWLLMVLRLDLRGALTKPDLGLLLPLLAGILAALLFFTKVVPLPALLASHPELVYGLFFGLILASILVLLGEVPGLGTGDVVTLTAGTALGLAVVNLVPMNTPDATWFIFVSGMIAISAMILPGISGSFILLILKKYAYIVEALGNFNFAVIIPFALGCLTGIILFSRVVVWMLHHYHRRTLLLITGILMGSLWMIWPFQQRSYEVVRGKQRLVGSTPVWPDGLDGVVMGSAGLMVVGFCVVIAVHLLSRHKTHPG